jgi:uncharacterized protein
VALSAYLDASVLVALFTPEPFSARADAFLRSGQTPPFVSDFAAAEFASAIARRVRARDFRKHHARAVFSSFDAWTRRTTQSVAISAADVQVAETFIRGLDLPLRTPDALHIAIAQRLGATLATFDEQMKTSATALGVSVAVL